MSSTTTSQQPPSDLMEALMKDPVKRAMLLQLLTKEKDGFEAYKRKEQKKNKNVTPVKNIPSFHFESPTALQRRRGLERLNNDSNSGSSSSEVSETAAENKGVKLPFEKLLQGVKAYVDVRRNNVDRSEGIKAVMKLMGATIKDQFTNDVTHVIFKDGSFTTYEKAKLMKIHLVSVLWLDAVRRNNMRVPEKNYPAFGSRVCDQNVSVLCSQLQKDYEDIVKDEKRRSMSALPDQFNKTIDKSRRKTIMSSQTSVTSYLTAQKSSRLLFPNEDLENNAISSRRDSNSSNITSDDSDCGMIDGQVSKRSKENLDLLNVSLHATNDSSKHLMDSGPSESLINRVTRGTIRAVTDMVITPNVEPSSNRQKENEGITKIPQNFTIQSSVMSSMGISFCNSEPTKSGLEQFVGISSRASSDRTESGLDKFINGSLSSELSKSKPNAHVQNKDNSSLIGTVTTMSSLRLSESVDNDIEETSNRRKIATNSGSNEREEILPVGRKSVSRKSSPLDCGARKDREISVSKSDQHVRKYSPRTSKNKTKNSKIRQRSASPLKSSESEDEFEGEVGANKTVPRTTSTSKQNLSKVKDKKTNLRRSSRRSSLLFVSEEENSTSSEERNLKVNTRKSRRRSVSLYRSESRDETKTRRIQTVSESSSETESEDRQLKRMSPESKAGTKTTAKIATKRKAKPPFSTLESDNEPNKENDMNERVNRSRKSSVGSYKSESEVKRDNSHNTRNGVVTLQSKQSPAKKLCVESAVTKQTGKSDDEVNKENDMNETVNRSSRKPSASSEDRKNINRNRKTRSVTPKIHSKPQANQTLMKKLHVENNSTKKMVESDDEANKENNLNKTINRRSTRTSSSSIQSESEDKSVSSRNRRNTPKVVSKPQPNHSPAKRLCVQNNATKKMRKLFNPHDVTAVSPSDSDKEREEYLKKKGKRCPDNDVFVNPNNVLVTSLHVKNKTKDTSLEPINWSSDENEVKQQKTKKKKPRKINTLKRDSSADEQKELLSLLSKKVGGKTPPTRSRLSQQKKPRDRLISSFSDTETMVSLPVSQVKRRSTLDFQTISQLQQKRKLKLDRKRKLSIACTKMHRHEVVEFENIVRDLGTFFVEDQVSDKTTHLVAGESKRTINMLRALARGCWILKPEWLTRSKEEGKWLSEEDYEIDDFSPAVQQCRLQRQAFGHKYCMDVFKDCGFIYIAKTTNPKPADLKELITTCKGKATTILRNAAIVVGEYIKIEQVPCVTETWVLDCITFNKLKPFKNYLIKPVGNESPQY